MAKEPLPFKPKASKVEEIRVTVPIADPPPSGGDRRNHNSTCETPQFRRSADAITRFHAVNTMMKASAMDYELEACTPTSRRSRSLAWLAAASGLALALFMFASPGAATPPGAEPVAQSLAAPGAHADHVTTGSIIRAAPVRLVHAPAPHGQNLPLPQTERHLLIVLLFACFAVMVAGGLALWKRGWHDIVQRARAEDL